MIDLHLHTTASDGACAPDELVARACAVGLRTIAVTDHDTVAAVGAATEAGRNAGVRVISGIEITAVWEERDVHVLGYFLPPGPGGLDEFLLRQRADRVRRVGEMGARLSALGAPIELAPILARAREGSDRSVGRPDVARALVAAGHVGSVREAFDRYLAAGQPGYVSRRGATPREVVILLRDIGAATSLAHPGISCVDAVIPDLVDAGLTALEAWHGDHDAETRHRYLTLAAQYGLAVTGGSDYHGEPTHRQAELGGCVLPAEDFARFCACSGQSAD